MSDGLRAEPRFYGRRKGKALRKGRAGALDHVLPRVRLALPPAGETLAAAGLFPAPKTDLWLEIGFGGGEHLAHQAETHPGVGFIGCEPFVNGVASLCAAIETRGLTNLRLLHDDARKLLPALPEAGLGRVFVLFPDPWPKKRHAPRRFIQTETLDRLAFALRDGGELRLASDDPTVLRWMLEKTWRHPAFRWLARSPADWRERPADAVPTRYEEKALRQGRRPVFLRFVRRPRGV
jgi:tRNA (guanine-N7-)-methyltransferase